MSENIKYLRIHWAREVKNLYSENYKSLVRKIEEKDTKKWKDIPYSWIWRINIVKMTTLPYRINSSAFNPYTYYIL